MNTEIQTFTTPVMGGISVENNILTVIDSGENHAGYGVLRLRLPVAGSLQFGVSWLIGYNDADNVFHYNTGAISPNYRATIYVVNPANNAVLLRQTKKFNVSMIDAPQLSISIPATGGLQVADIYLQVGNNGDIYDNYSHASRYDEHGNFIGTYDYIVREKCRLIYDHGEFFPAEPHLLTEDMPAVVPQLFESNYPDMLWRTDGFSNQGKIFSPLIPNMESVGAFLNVGSLEDVVIPKSCKKIGLVSFYGTSLKKVKIAKDCSYSTNSFPSECTVQFYSN